MKPVQRTTLWPPERDAILRWHYPHLTNAVVGALLGCTAKQAAHRAERLGLYKTQTFKSESARRTTSQRSPWGWQLEEIMVLLYPHAAPGQLETLLGMNSSTLVSKAQCMGLKKDPELLSRVAKQHQLALRQKDEAAYLQSRFRTGHSTWNKGTRGVAKGGVQTQFKPGAQPPTTRPVGTVRAKSVSGVRDVLMQKVAQPNHWRAVHWLVWEEYTGQPQPPGWVMTFKDGCRQNLNPDNLQPMTRKQLALRASPLCNQTLSREHGLVLRLRGALTRTITQARQRLDSAAETAAAAATTTTTATPESKP